MKGKFAAVAALLIVAAPVAGARAGQNEVGPRDRCPVCGMFVARTPSWIASVTYRGGDTYYFDGPKDMFRYYFGLSKYAKDRKPSEIQELSVTEYYSAKRIRAQDALYAVGSDVLGPMGVELVPILGKPQAEAFLKDHKAKRILSYKDVTPELLEKME